jgi:hypothetical protein
VGADELLVGSNRQLSGVLELCFVSQFFLFAISLFRWKKPTM